MIFLAQVGLLHQGLVLGGYYALNTTFQNWNIAFIFFAFELANSKGSTCNNNLTIGDGTQILLFISFVS
jgi:hypothetical protein